MFNDGVTARRRCGRVPGGMQEGATPEWLLRGVKAAKQRKRGIGGQKGLAWIGG